MKHEVCCEWKCLWLMQYEVYCQWKCLWLVQHEVYSQWKCLWLVQQAVCCRRIKPHPPIAILDTREENGPSCRITVTGCTNRKSDSWKGHHISTHSFLRNVGIVVSVHSADSLNSQQASVIEWKVEAFYRHHLLVNYDWWKGSMCKKKSFLMETRRGDRQRTLPNNSPTIRFAFQRWLKFLVAATYIRHKLCSFRA